MLSFNDGNVTHRVLFQFILAVSCKLHTKTRNRFNTLYAFTFTSLALFSRQKSFRDIGNSSLLRISSPVSRDMSRGMMTLGKTRLSWRSDPTAAASLPGASRRCFGSTSWRRIRDEYANSE